VSGAIDAAPQKLVVRDLSVYYGQKKALGPVSMQISEKRVTALIGLRGAENRPSCDR
jgi:ABC-type phosphate transport system ATPase subunit